MDITNGDIITTNDKNYLILESARYEEIEYLFTNKLNDAEETTEEYFVMKKNNDEVEIIRDKKILDILLPVFSKKLQKEIDEYNEQTKFEIN